MEGFTLSYSQCGEDLALKTIFGKNRRSGFYIDIGCNNPIQKSNTFKLYLKGWTGICVDGNGSLINQFKKIRKRDICLEAIVSDSKRELTFYQDNQNHELSSLDPAVGEELKANGSTLVEIKAVSTTLEEILDAHCQQSVKLDLLCVDVENHDLEVLKGNNFEKYRPEVICIEFFVDDLTMIGQTELDVFMRQKGYEVLSYSAPNIFYRDKAAVRRPGGH
jgi:FkbM family methyltransferase